MLASIEPHSHNEAGGPRDLQGRWRPGQRLLSVRVDGRQRIVQVRRVGRNWDLQTRGASHRVQVLPAHVAELSRHMIEKPAPDLSRHLTTRLRRIELMERKTAHDFDQEARSEFRVGREDACVRRIEAFRAFHRGLANCRGGVRVRARHDRGDGVVGAVGHVVGGRDVEAARGG